MILGHSYAFVASLPAQQWVILTFNSGLGFRASSSVFFRESCCPSGISLKDPWDRRTRHLLIQKTPMLWLVWAGWRRIRVTAFTRISGESGSNLLRFRYFIDVFLIIRLKTARLSRELTANTTIANSYSTAFSVKRCVWVTLGNRHDRQRTGHQRKAEEAVVGWFESN